MRLKVLVDATAIPVDRGGVGRYLEALLPVLESENIRIAVVCKPNDIKRLGEIIPASTLIPAPRRLNQRPIRLAWEQTGLPGLVRKVRADVLHSPHYTMPRFSPVPVTVTLHDATFFSHPGLHTAVKGRFFRYAIHNAVKYADTLVVPSCATQREVQREAGGEDSVFYVAHHGVDQAIFHPTDNDEKLRVAKSLGLNRDQPYIGFLGTLEPRKNVPALIRAWAGWAIHQSPRPALVLAGGRGWDEQVDREIARIPEELTILRPGFLPLADLSGFLSGAEIVAYPSLGEGFGLPVLEAMACGSAVLTTRELSLPEVGGNAVWYCGTTDTEIAEGLARLTRDPKLRMELADASLNRSAQFTWEKAAEIHRQAFTAAANLS